MALAPRPQILHFHLPSPAAPSPVSASLFLSFPTRWPPSLSKNDFLSAFSPVSLKVPLKTNCLRSATEEEDRLSESETLSDDEAGYGDAKIQQLDKTTTASGTTAAAASSSSSTGSMRVSTSSYSDSLSLGIREPVYEVCLFAISCVGVPREKSHSRIL